jgi:UDP-2,4-diacetamido-2,4,6-trideoxy-beta-L-altropyranose hydrolase
LPVVAAPSEGYGPWLGASIDADAGQAAAIAATLGGVDVLITDHYAIDRNWQQQLRPHARVILAIDDLSDRPLDADVLLDQNFGRTVADYAGHVPPGCKVLAGPQYALLRPEFAARRSEALARRSLFSGVKRLLVSLGGADPHGYTAQVLRLVADVAGGSPLAVTAITGDAVAAARLRRTALGFPATILTHADDMAALMTAADVAIGAVGGSAWERACLGLPTLALILADNQRPAAERLKAAGLITDAVPPQQLTANHIHRLLALDATDYAALATANRAVCDGEGAARVAAVVRQAHEVRA